MSSFIRVKCSCGKTLQIPVHLRGKRVECPACGGTNAVSADLPARAEAPARGPGLWWKAGWLSLFGFLGLLLVGGVLFFIVKVNEQEPPELGQASIQELQPLKKKDALAQPPPPPVAPKNLEVVFDRFEPPQPQAGKAVTVFLKASSEGRRGPLIFHYRQGPKEAWHIAADGRFTIPDLKAGSLTLEARVVDAEANTSPPAQFVLAVEQSPGLILGGENQLELVLQTGHTLVITSVALSGDDKYVLTGSYDNTAILWAAASGKKLRTFRGHTGAVRSVALSGDGKHLVTGSDDKTAILWEAASGKKLHTFQGQTNLVMSVALSGDGKYVVTGSRDRTAILWEAATGKQLQTFRGDPVRSVALSADGKHLVIGSDYMAVLWEAATGKELQAFQAQTGGSVALSGDGKYVVTGSWDRDKPAALWEAASGKKLQTFHGHTDEVHSVALSGDGKYVVTGSADKTAALWAVASGKKLHTFKGHTRMALFNN